MSIIALDTEVLKKPLPMAGRPEAAVRRYTPPALSITPHPAWIEAMKASVQKDWEAAVWPSVFKRTAEGNRPPLRHWQRVLSNFFYIVEMFPKYMGLSLAKTTYTRDASARRWLLQNMAVEAKHTEWLIDWAAGCGVSAEQLLAHTPSPEILELHQHLWDTCQKGSLAEGVAASNWAIEGVTGEWTPAVEKNFRLYAADGVRIDGVSMMWLKAHARYDDAHPHEALEIIKASTDGQSDEPVRVTEAARKSLNLFQRAIESCCQD